MKEAGLTIQERQLVTLMRWWVALFAIATIAFAALPKGIISLLNRLGELLKWGTPAVAPFGEPFWLVLAISLLVVLSVAAYLVQKDVLHNIKYTRLVILSKFVSSISYIISYFLFERSFAYFAAFAVDGLIGLITWFYYRRAVLSRYVI